jgi:hypothetical protein
MSAVRSFWDHWTRSLQLGGGRQRQPAQRTGEPNTGTAMQLLPATGTDKGGVEVHDGHHAGNTRRVPSVAKPFRRGAPVPPRCDIEDPAIWLITVVGSSLNKPEKRLRCTNRRIAAGLHGAAHALITRDASEDERYKCALLPHLPCAALKRRSTTGGVRTNAQPEYRRIGAATARRRYWDGCRPPSARRLTWRGWKEIIRSALLVRSHQP